MELGYFAVMDAQDEMLLREQLGELRSKHRELDARLAEIELAAAHDQLTLTRLKKQKLVLKDQINRLEDRLFPDIIA
ncbi:MAG: hypothetical protein ACI89J_000148 [Hyphomicrobiaceae bacterium]|jgi:hypothetical protein